MLTDIAPCLCCAESAFQPLVPVLPAGDAACRGLQKAWSKASARS